jgi:hypothetical protein
MSIFVNETLGRVQRATRIYDLCLAWEWQYDLDFVHLLEAACQKHGISLLQITPPSLDRLLPSLANYEVAFRAFLDRASDAEPRFLALIDWVRSQEVLRINRFRNARQAWNKVFCQEKFAHTGLTTPTTLVIPSYLEEPLLTPLDLSPLGSTFSIKPAHGGGGQGVVNEATTWEQVLAARQCFPADQYLLQASVTPVELAGRKAWFRVLYCAGDIYPCWWDTRTHEYSSFVPLPDQQFLDYCLRDILHKIARICKLELFSTEIAYTQQAGCVIVDYINDPVDLRLQSKTVDGVPDQIVIAIADRLATLAASVA